MSENIPDDMVDSGPADQTSSSRSFQKSTSTGSLDFHMEALNLKSEAPMLDEWSSDIVDLDDSALSSTCNGPKSRSPRSPGKGASRTRSSGILRRRPTPQIEVFQSITCMPAHRQRSFEELRLECYRVSILTTGHPPAPVPVGAEHRAVIPPSFVPFIDVPGEGTDDGDGEGDVIMSSQPNIASAFTFGPRRAAGEE